MILVEVDVKAHFLRVQNNTNPISSDGANTMSNVWIGCVFTAIAGNNRTTEIYNSARTCGEAEQATQIYVISTGMRTYSTAYHIGDGFFFSLGFFKREIWKTEKKCCSLRILHGMDGMKNSHDGEK